ncbi:uncharacterized protein LOC125561066 [Nematostella vectensis]|uniref:uncharacterized protein LOC125561066 n=1 Tax=Nematostella vectensis TaxID=45351 RepID=UPI002077327D|nr:uncharacterized protein LOC125561066 [Nematostella vectensis]
MSSAGPKRSRRLAARQVGGPNRGRTNRDAAADAPVREMNITPQEDRAPQVRGRKRARTRITQTNDSNVSDIQSNNTPQEKDSSNAQDEIHQTPPSQVQIPESVIQEVVQRVTAELSKQLLPCPSTSTQHQVDHNSRPSEVIVEEAIAAARAAHTGQPAMQGTGPAAMPGNLFSSPSLPVDARVSDKLKAKIWQNEFVEFGLLLANPILEGKYQLTLSASQNGAMPALNVEPVSKTKKYLSIENWISCFHIFVGVYTQKYCHEAPALMKYGETIQDLASRGHDWRYYDENFRFLRQGQPSAYPWQNTHWELWLRSQRSALPSSAKQQNESRNLRGNSLVRGYCYRFSRGNPCSGDCGYKHKCHKCDGDHRPGACTFRAPKRTSNHSPAASPQAKPQQPRS